MSATAFHFPSFFLRLTYLCTYKRAESNKRSIILQTAPCYSGLDNTHTSNVREVAASVRLCNFLPSDL